jgi:hypothetical protein
MVVAQFTIALVISDHHMAMDTAGRFMDISTISTDLILALAKVLPFGYYPFYFGNTQFFYSGGLYYRQYEREYKVVVPPVGAEVPNLPDDAQEVTVNGTLFFEYKGVYYQAREKAEGKTVYVIAGKDGVLDTGEGNHAENNEDVRIGDEVQQLPEGCAEVTLKGVPYFVSPDGVYYEKVITDDKVSYKIVGL